MWSRGRVEEASKFHVLSFYNIFIFHMYKDLMNITKMYKMEIYIEREREREIIDFIHLFSLLYLRNYATYYEI